MRRRSVIHAAWALLTAAAIASVTFAQTAPQSAAGPGDEPLETVVVTGSHIRRTQAETPSPLQVITAE